MSLLSSNVNSKGLILCLLFLLAGFGPQYGQSLSPNDPIPYQGYRVYISNLKVNNALASEGSVHLTLVNTGRESFSFSPELREKMIIRIAESSKMEYEDLDQSSFLDALFSSGINLTAGQIVSGEKIVLGKSSIGVTNPETDLSAESWDKDITEAAPTVKAPEVKTEAEADAGCSDLVLESIQVSKQTKANITLQYSIKNVGGKEVSFGMGNDQVGLALQGHLSSSESLSRGALPLGGQYIKPNNKEEVIQPGSSFSGEMKFPILKLTKFTPYLIMQVDPYQTVSECDETNNVNHINLIPDSPFSKN
ncbi:MAG: hypothetical protein HKN16_10435 [Saprospiraceae bacterium]|nr:hypothetical protein [Saprospiraceae bacterium]